MYINNAVKYLQKIKHICLKKKVTLNPQGNMFQESTHTHTNLDKLWNFIDLIIEFLRGHDMYMLK